MSFTIKDTGEVIKLDYRYEYNPEEDTPVPQQKVERIESTIDDVVNFQNLEKSFSSNGVHAEPHKMNILLQRLFYFAGRIHIAQIGIDGNLE